MSQAKVFTVGVVLGAAIGAALFAPIVHLLLIGVGAATLGLAVFRGRRLLLRRPDRKSQLEA